MAKSLSTGSEWIWISNADPGVSETNVFQGNLWLNTASNAIFICKDPTVGAQVWEKYPTSPVTVGNGGTGATSFTQSNGIVTYNGSTLVNYAGPQIDSSGRATNGSQPAFLAYLAATATNKTGNGASYTLGTDALTEVYDHCKTP